MVLSGPANRSTPEWRPSRNQGAVGLQDEQRLPLRKSRLHSSLEDLSAYIDGALEGEQRARVASAIAADSDLAALLAAYEAQSASLNEFESDVLSEPIPPRLLDAMEPRRDQVDRRPRAAAVAAVVTAVLAGLGAGWWGSEFWRDRDAVLRGYVADAVIRHAEINAEELAAPELNPDEKFLAGVDAPFDVPARWAALRDLDLTPYAFRSLTQQDVSAGLLHYRDPDGRPVSLYVRKYPGRDETPFMHATEDGQTIAYWLDGPLAYIVVGDLSEERITEIGRAVYGGSAQSLGSAEQAQASKADPDMSAN